MGTSRSLAVLLAGLVALAAAHAEDRPADPVPVLVELFTSEGCSSCPPADALLARLVAEQPVAGARIVGVSQHVDYWDGLGWRDPFSSAEATERQRDYAGLVDAGRIYTPQMVIDGGDQFVGSDVDRALAAIARATARDKARLTLAPRLDDDGRPRVDIAIDGLPADGSPLAVTVVAVQRRTRVDVRRGENAGRRLDHTAVARGIERAGTIRRGATAFRASAVVPVPPAADPADFDVVVFAQAEPVGRVIAAGSAALGAPASD